MSRWFCCPTGPLCLQGGEICSGKMKRWSRPCPSSWCDTGQQLRAFWCPKLMWERWQCPCVSKFTPPGQFLVFELLGMFPYPSGFMRCFILKEIKIPVSELPILEISTGLQMGCILFRIFP